MYTKVQNYKFLITTIATKNYTMFTWIIVDCSRIDLDKRHVEYDLSMPRLEMLTTYNVSGRILLLPIMGHGQGNITMGEN